MSDLLAARVQMGVSLGFHILFAVAGMAMPLLMAVAEGMHLRTGDPIWKELAKRWAKGTAILFAVGAVSGTVLSFELGLLWPTFMEHAGPLIGMPFSLEGFAFFIEAIFLGIYLYGWDRVSPRMHLAAAVIVAVSGLASGVFVVAVNAWMNTPAGFEVVDGKFVNIDLVAAAFSKALPTQASHMAVAAYSSVAFAVMGVHAFMLRRSPDSRFHQRAFALAFGLALVATPLQLVTGDLSAKHIARHQPSKLAAAEALYTTQAGAPLNLFGLHIPKMLSVLAFADPDAVVTGLDAIPEDDRPPVRVVHWAFQIMVLAGLIMIGLVAWGVWVWRRLGAPWKSRRLLTAFVWAAPVGLIAVEAGWVVTEVGRQPWIIRGVMRTAEAVTPMPGLVVPLTVFCALYLALGLVVIGLLRAHVFRT